MKELLEASLALISVLQSCSNENSISPYKQALDPWNLIEDPDRSTCSYRQLVLTERTKVHTGENTAASLTNGAGHVAIYRRIKLDPYVSSLHSSTSVGSPSST